MSKSYADELREQVEAKRRKKEQARAYARQKDLEAEAKFQREVQQLSAQKAAEIQQVKDREALRDRRAAHAEVSPRPVERANAGQQLDGNRPIRLRVGARPRDKWRQGLCCRWTAGRD